MRSNGMKTHVSCSRIRLQMWLGGHCKHLFCALTGACYGPGGPAWSHTSLCLAHFPLGLLKFVPHGVALEDHPEVITNSEFNGTCRPGCHQICPLHLCCVMKPGFFCVQFKMQFITLKFYIAWDQFIYGTAFLRTYLPFPPDQIGIGNSTLWDALHPETQQAITVLTFCKLSRLAVYQRPGTELKDGCWGIFGDDWATGFF